MVASVLYRILLGTGIAVSLMVFFRSALAMALLLSRVKETVDFVFLASLVFGIAGHVGLWMALMAPGRQLRIIILLALGILGWILYIEWMELDWSWRLLFYFEEWSEWLLIFWPPLIELMAIGVNVWRWFAQLKSGANLLQGNDLPSS